ncbi:MAG: uL22 family ribosomal protein [Candidatus Aenigmatarchaeota archaeon]
MIASAYIKNLRISTKHATYISKIIRGKNALKAKKFLELVAKQKLTLDGKKYYLKATKAILKALESALANARQKGLDENKLKIKIIEAHKGFKLRTPKRWKFRGREKKNTHIKIVLSY